MKTISGNCVSSKQISLSKAAKILSKFVSVDNGASQVTNAYLHRASTAFDELNQLHKELKLPHSHKRKKGQKTEETHDDSGRVVENPVRSFEINWDLNHRYLQSKNEFSRQQLGNENADEDGEKLTQPVVKLSQELDGSIGYNVGNGGNEKHKKNKRKQEIESRHDGNSNVKLGDEEGEGKLSINVQNETASGREHENEGDGNMGMKEGKKQKKKKNEEDKVSVQNGNESGREQGNEGVDNMGMEKGKKQKKEGDKSSVQNGTESGQEQGNEGDGNMGMEEGKKLKKDKKEDKEGTGDMTKKRMKRKHEDDP